MARTVLLLDTPSGALQAVGRAFQSAMGKGAQVEVFPARDKLLHRIASGLPYDLVALDIDLVDGAGDQVPIDPAASSAAIPGAGAGLELVREIRKRDEVVPIVALAETGSVECAARAVQAGATDFLVREGELAKRIKTLLHKVSGLLRLMERNRVLDEQNRLLHAEARGRYRIIGESPQIRAVIDRVERVAAIPRPVLILGERGTGKELIARAIHQASGVAAGPFVTVNCAAFSDALLESELFGHERGAFTGAESRTAGKFEQAAGGTLFLDEIGNMSLPFQQKILRAVEYGSFTRVGGREEVATDARIITATNADLKAKMEAGAFLRDLYDRLTFEIIEAPPLRRREGDVEILARHFLNQFMGEIPALGGKRWSQAATEALKAYPFPGNVRELKNIVERAAYRDVTNEITPVDIGMLPEAGAGSSTVVVTAGGPFKEQVERFEQSLLEEALRATGGNQAEAARRLELSYDQFRYYYRKYKDTLASP